MHCEGREKEVEIHVTEILFREIGTVDENLKIMKHSLGFMINQLKFTLFKEI